MATTLPRKECFEIPRGVIYLDGNSLGPLPRGSIDRVRQTVSDEWGCELIRAWNTAGWISLPQRVGNRIAGLIGAAEGSVATGDTLSIKVYQALEAALNMRPERKVILSDSGNFPSDLYIADGLIRSLDKGHELQTPAPEHVIDHISDQVAAVLLTHVDYRTGRMHDMAAVTGAAHRAGAIMIWDLAHSAGAMPLDLESSQAEFAVGCTYKYLNGGPGAPAFIYVRPDIIGEVQPALAGWMGHADPFSMEPEYRPAGSTERLRVGTPAVLQLSVLDHALNVWEGIDMADIRSAATELSDLFIEQVEKRCPQLTLASPRDSTQRGSQVSFAFDQGYAAIQALAASGLIGDFRAPDIMRFGFTPLYIDRRDVLDAADIVEDVIGRELWRNPAYRVRSRVT
jgi:kynureninase